MANKMYVGANNQAKEVRKLYVGINGQAKKVKRIYTGVNGIAKRIYNIEKDFQYNGDWQLELDIDGRDIWIDNSGTIYYSHGDEQYYLDSYGIWKKKGWSGTQISNFYGKYIWYEKVNDSTTLIYYSYGTSHYKLSDEGRWESMTWSGINNFDGHYTWQLNNKIFLSKGNENYWKTVGAANTTWQSISFLITEDIYGQYVWFAFGKAYYSLRGSYTYVFDGTRTWSRVNSISPTAGVDGKCVWSDGTNIYCSMGTSYILGGTATAPTWTEYTFSGAPANLNGDYIWTDENDRFYFSQGEYQYRYDISVMSPQWSSYYWLAEINESFSGQNIWTDYNNKIYYSNNNKTYAYSGPGDFVWTKKSWTGTPSNFNGYYIWKDELGNIYYSFGANHYSLSGSFWNTCTMVDNNGNSMSFNGNDIWTDGEFIYLSNVNKQYRKVPGERAWTNIYTAGKLYPRYGNYVWSDGTNLYCSDEDREYIYNRSTKEWELNTSWTGLPSGTILDGSDFWTDDNGNSYCSSLAVNPQLILNETTWEPKTWSRETQVRGRQIWSDGVYIHSGGTSGKDYILVDK